MFPASLQIKNRFLRIRQRSYKKSPIKKAGSDIIPEPASSFLFSLTRPIVSLFFMHLT